MKFSIEEIRSWAARGEAVSPHVVLEMVQAIEEKDKLIEFIKNRACWCIIQKLSDNQHTIACKKSSEYLNR